jgi:hypothetical protein
LEAQTIINNKNDENAFLFISNHVLGSLCAVVLMMTLDDVLAAPAMCPKDPKIIGYSDFAMLKDDLNNLADDRTTYIICPGTTFRLDSDNLFDEEENYLYVPSSDTLLTIQCGATGKTFDECIFRGGHHHVKMSSPGNIFFKGITFESAQLTSIYVESKEAQLSFSDCIWKVSTVVENDLNNVFCLLFFPKNLELACTIPLSQTRCFPAPYRAISTYGHTY